MATRTQNCCHEICDTWWHSWLRHCATGRQVVDSIPDGTLEILLDLIHPGSTQHMTEMSVMDIS